MSPYENRGLTLDPGLTALALRGLNERDGHYPFIDRFRSRRGSRTRPSNGRSVHSTSRWEKTLRWCGLRRSIAPA
jgi:hypothetical protein